MPHCDKDETGQNALCDRYLNNRGTGKGATKPRSLGLLGHSVYLTVLYVDDSLVYLQHSPNYLIKSVTISSIDSMNWYTKVKDIPGLNMTFVDDLRTEETTLLDLLTHRTGLATADFLLVAGYPDDIATRKKLSE